jgi:hypothetical protein
MALVYYNVIWPPDRRIPSVASRRAWAFARNLNLDSVNCWWYRRKLVSSRARLTIPKNTYELDVGTPPTLCWSRTMMSRMKRTGSQGKVTLPTILISNDPSCLPSSKTIFCDRYSQALTRPPIPPYHSSQPPNPPHLSENAHIPGTLLASCPTFDSASKLSIPIRSSASSPLPPSSPPPPASTPDSDKDLGLQPEPSLCGLTLEERPQVLCNQSLDDNSDFTCSLCT